MYSYSQLLSLSHLKFAQLIIIIYPQYSQDLDILQTICMIVYYPLYFAVDLDQMSIRRFTLSIIRGTHLDDHAALAEALSQCFVVVYQCWMKSLDTLGIL